MGGYLFDTPLELDGVLFLYIPYFNILYTVPYMFYFTFYMVLFHHFIFLGVRN